MTLQRTIGRLDRPPQPNARAKVAPEFGRRFLILADAEEEFDWSRSLSRQNTSTEAIASLPAATRRLRARGVTPTYLLDYPVVHNERSAAIVQGMVAHGDCEIGTQLHPWVNPPHAEEVTGRNSFAGNLPFELEHEKLATLTERIASVAGQRPIVYRAGRYGIGPNTAAILEDLGYRMDVSTRALFTYECESGPDFSRYPIWPWWITDRLLELPLTAAFTGRFRRWPALHRAARFRGPLAVTGLLNRVSLTPEGTPLQEALEAIRQLLDDDTRLFSLSFHTPSVEPGHTPYVRDQHDLGQFWRWWDGVLDLFARAGVLPATPNDVLAAVC